MRLLKIRYRNIDDIDVDIDVNVDIDIGICS